MSSCILCIGVEINRWLPISMIRVESAVRNGPGCFRMAGIHPAAHPVRREIDKARLHTSLRVGTDLICWARTPASRVTHSLCTANFPEGKPV